MKKRGHQNVYDADPPQFLSGEMRAFVADVNARAGEGVPSGRRGPKTETDIDPGPPVGKFAEGTGGHRSRRERGTRPPDSRRRS